MNNGIRDKNRSNTGILDIKKKIDQVKHIIWKDKLNVIDSKNGKSQKAIEKSAIQKPKIIVSVLKDTTKKVTGATSP